MGFKIVSVSPSEPIPSFVNTTLIMPTLSIGNVAQLAVDFIISTLSLKRIAYIDEPTVLPCVGNDAFDKQNEGKLYINIEVFFSAECALTVIQQRGPVIRGKCNTFTTNLIEWIQASQFKQVILLSSADASHRIDPQIIDSIQLRYITTSSKNIDQTLLHRLKASGLKELENGTQSHDQMEIEVSQSLSKMQIGQTHEISTLDPTAFLRRAGITHRFFRLCKNNYKDVKAIGLIIFCAEGDNIPEAATIATAANILLQFSGDNKVDWIAPKSWELIRGPSYDTALYM